MNGGRVPCCDDVAGLILAGGQGRRMGGRHKAFLQLAGRPLIEQVAERLRPQVAHLAISANAQAGRLREHADMVLADVVPGHAGPLAGILSGLEWLREKHPEIRWLLSVAVDTPFFPRDLCRRMRVAVADNGALAVASRCGRRQPVFALWPVGCEKRLRQALVEEGLRRVEAFQDRCRVVEVAFDEGRHDPFFNINEPDDLKRAEALLSAA